MENKNILNVINNIEEILKNNKKIKEDLTLSEL